MAARDTSKNIRLNRLKEDHRRMIELKSKTELINFELLDVMPNSPPEKYLIKYSCRGITGCSGNNPIYSTDHKVKIYLWAEYPRRQPDIRFTTPIWHPNIGYTSREVCLNIWAAGRGLDELCIMIGEMIQYRQYNIKSALEPKAADWARKNKRLFPIDERPLILGDPTCNIKINDKEAEIEITLHDEGIDDKIKLF